MNQQLRLTLARSFFILFFLSLLSFSTSAETLNLVINSKNWKDVYAGTMYAQWLGHDFYYVVSTAHADVLLSHVRFKYPIALLESDQPYVTNYKNKLEPRFQVKEILQKTESLTWPKELGQRINTTKFVVLDGKFGYNAISVVSYALREKAWVLFAEEFTPDALASYLRDRNASYVLQYGALTDDYRQAISTFNLETIDQGNRFSNNVALLEKTLSKKSALQLTLATGEFIERNLINGVERDPTLLIGSENLPDVSVDFLKKHNIQYGVLIGSDQSDVARWIKQNTPVKYMFVKFGQTFIQKGSAVSEPWALTLFYLPKVPLNVSIEKIQYNKQTRQLEVAYQNQEATRTYLKGRVTVFLGNATNQNVEDDAVTVLESKSTKSAAYSITIDEELLSAEANMSVEVTGNYGEEPGALERKAVQRAENLAVVSFTDESLLQLGPLVYNPSRQGFELELINSGPVKAFFSPHLRWIINGQEKSAAVLTASMGASERQTVFFYSPLSKDELAGLRGGVVSVLLDYGAREAYLTKTLTEDRLFSLSQSTSGQNQIDWTLIVIALVVLAALLYFFTRGSGASGAGHFSARRRF